MFNHQLQRKRDQHLHFHFPISGSCRAMNLPLSLPLQTRQPTYPQPFLIDTTSRPFPSFAALLRMLSGTLATFPYCGEQNCTQYSSWGCTNNKYKYVFWLDGYDVFSVSQNAVCSLGCQGTVLAHVKPAVNQYPQMSFLWAALQPLISQSAPSGAEPGILLCEFCVLNDCSMLQYI